MTFTTAQAAHALGISRASLYTWIREHKIEAPDQIRWCGRTRRVWTEADIERVKSARKKFPRRGRPLGSRNRIKTQHYASSPIIEATA
jgi:excisionase family DNA binding protein